jgi:drug/metabolite transporter (DMT)-like permease
MSIAARYMFIATIFFVFAHSSIKGLSHVPLHEIIFFRSIVSLVICLGYFYSRKTPIRKNINSSLILRGVFGTLSMVLYFYTLTVMPLATAVTLNYLSPLFSLLFAIILVGERPKPRVWIFITIALIGVFLTKGFNNNIPWFGFVAAILGAVLAGAAYAFVRKAGRKTAEPMLIVFILPAVSMGPSLISMVTLDFVVPTISELAVLTLMSLAVFVAQYCMTMAYYLGEVSRVSIITYFTIIWSILVGYFFFNETLQGEQILGLGMILSALVFSEALNFRDKKLKAKLAMGRP